MPRLGELSGAWSRSPFACAGPRAPTAGPGAFASVPDSTRETEVTTMYTKAEIVRVAAVVDSCTCSTGMSTTTCAGLIQSSDC
ncbi:hypothetical protein D7V97_35560 [Corallococcus sp. CA053C]|nr:hypothetical protein D7V97_35560 [Corallococcus sp. CA053C]